VRKRQDESEVKGASSKKFSRLTQSLLMEGALNRYIPRLCIQADLEEKNQTTYAQLYF